MESYRKRKEKEKTDRVRKARLDRAKKLDW